MCKPALAPSDFSGSNLMVAPSLPPELSDLSKVPLECHATLMAMGQAFAFWLTNLFQISVFNAFFKKLDEKSLSRLYSDMVKGGK
jgi:hypothetical protein